MAKKPRDLAFTLEKPRKKRGFPSGEIGSHPQITLRIEPSLKSAMQAGAAADGMAFSTWLKNLGKARLRQQALEAQDQADE